MEKNIFVLALALCYASGMSTDQDAGLTRIANGNIARENQFPYAVSLQLMSASTLPHRGHRCGGALFTRQHALTAATCLFDYVSGAEQLIQASLYHLFAGAIHITNTAPDRIRPVANFTIHPELILSSHFNDIAIITTITPYPVTGSAVPIPLPAVDHDPADFTQCTVAGWGGGDRTIEVSPQLMYANKYVYNQNLCSSIFNLDLSLPNIMPSMVCAASFNSLSTGCERDIGNALVCNSTLTGILFHDQNCGPTTFPELYTRINNYTTWIRTISSSHTFAPGAFMLFFLTVLIFITA